MYSKEKQKRINEQMRHQNAAAQAKPKNQKELGEKIDPSWTKMVQHICNMLISIANMLEKPRPVPGNRKKRDDKLDQSHKEKGKNPENDPNLPFAKEMEKLRKNPLVKKLLQQVQSLVHELSEQERGNIALFGATLPGSIRNVVQQFITGNTKGAAGYSNVPGQELIGGPQNDATLGLKEKVEMRGLQEGGEPAEVEDASQKDLGISQGAPKPCPIDCKAC